MTWIPSGRLPKPSARIYPEAVGRDWLASLPSRARRGILEASRSTVETVAAKSDNASYS